MATKTATDITNQPLAILGGPMAVPERDEGLFHWPIVTDEDERAVLEVLRAGTMSGVDVTMKFEAEFARYIGARHALTYPNGTLALQVAMWAAGLRRGDEMICPTVTYWASAMPALALGATPVFADVDPHTLCIDPSDIERHITPRTRAIMVVHLCGHPADMDAIMPIARKHDLTVIEDVSHAHGTLYKGKMTGTFGRVAAMSMMAEKSFPVGEGGVLVTDDADIIQNAIMFAHYRRHDELTRPDLVPFAGVPFGGIKGRLNQMCSAMGRVQLKHYQARIEEIQGAMNRFWDLLDGVPGLRPHRTEKDSGSTMGGWYCPLGHYLPEELDGLPVETFIDAVNAEGGESGQRGNIPLHLHPTFNDAVIYERDGKPTRIANADRDLRQPPGSLPVAESLAARNLGIPRFKHDKPELIERYAAAWRKVALQADKLLD